MTDYAELRRLAEAATPGPWRTGSTYEQCEAKQARIAELETVLKLISRSECSHCLGREEEALRRPFDPAMALLYRQEPPMSL